MKARPILFSTPMVQSLLDGSKGMTRRVLKPQPVPYEPEPGKHWWDCKAVQAMVSVEDELMNGEGGWDGFAGTVCPYGMKGDLLWVRETLRKDTLSWRYKADNRLVEPDQSRLCSIPRDYIPSIHMHKWASRITLEITEAVCEQLQDISEADAKAEGITMVPFYPDDGYPLSQGFMVGRNDGKAPLETSAKNAFTGLWKSINGLDSWDKNPWVWVVKFNVHKMNVYSFIK